MITAYHFPFFLCRSTALSGNLLHKYSGIVPYCFCTYSKNFFFFHNLFNSWFFWYPAHNNTTFLYPVLPAKFFCIFTILPTLTKRWVKQQGQEVRIHFFNSSACMRSSFAVAGRNGNQWQLLQMHDFMLLPFFLNYWYFFEAILKKVRHVHHQFLYQ